MKKIKLTLASLAVMIGIVGAPALLLSDTVSADPAAEIKKGSNSVGGNASGTPDLGDTIKKVINALLFLLGAIAVIMIVIGGFRYVLSGGDSSSTKAAKDTILYAVIGLVVAIMAYAIVNFVIGAF